MKTKLKCKNLIISWGLIKFPSDWLSLWLIECVVFTHNDLAKQFVFQHQTTRRILFGIQH